MVIAARPFEETLTAREDAVTRDEARRIAANIAKPPEMLRKP